MREPLINVTQLPRSIVGVLLTLIPVAFVSAEDFVQLETMGMSVVRKLTINEKADGYRGIYYRVSQTGGGEYKYSGGMATYPAKLQDFAVYCPQVNKTFFCFGGAAPDNNIHLLHMVSYFDHETGVVPRPTIILDKQTSDAHDNPVISIDENGYIWIFSPSHGQARPSYIHRSVRPWDIDEFKLVVPHWIDDNRDRFLSNFSYVQVFYHQPVGFSCFFTRYGDASERTSYFMTSRDGRRWSNRRRIAAIERGHYQIAAGMAGKVATVMNYHPQDKGIDGRTNLYYLESTNQGETWQNAQKQFLDTPLVDIHNPALVVDFASEQRLVFLKDLVFDQDGNPVVLFVTSKNPNHGEAGGPRAWTIARFANGRWTLSEIGTSDHNYDCGSLDVRKVPWRLIAPTGPGPYPNYTGGEMVLWESDDKGASWRKVKSLTRNIGDNHTYSRLVVNAHDDFYAIWADSDPRQISSSSLYFCNASGDVFRLPRQMDGETARPKQLIDALNPLENAIEAAQR